MNAMTIRSDAYTDGIDTWSVWQGRRRVASYFTSREAARAWIEARA
jgi:hypothetical protein